MIQLIFLIFHLYFCWYINLIIGTIDIDVEGKFQVTNEMGDICEVEMIPSTSGQKGNLHGEIKDINGYGAIPFSGL